MILKLSNQEYNYSFTVDDLNNGEKLFYKFQIPAGQVKDGKYDMVLTDNEGNIIAEEQVCVGYFNNETIQYNRGQNVYINSPLDANIEEVRTITIDVPNYTIYPSEGYDAMKEVVVDAQPVYDSGYTAGEVEQKSKLTNITISENGTYTREDGYNTVVVDVPDTNGDYNEGYDAGKIDGYDSGYTAGIDYASENAGEIAAANAIDLVATKFGPYYTIYSENIVNPNPITGIYPDGETFHNLGLTNKVYDTGILANETTKLEIWVNFNNTNNKNSNFLISNYDSTLGGAWGIYKNVAASYTNIKACVGGSSEISYALDFNTIYHIELSYTDGLIVNGEQIGTFSNYGSRNSTLLLNGYGKQPEDIYKSIGMVKITTDGITNVIIPTANGFKNITTNQILESVYSGGTYEYINNDPIILDNLIKSVDVQPKIDVGKNGIKFGNSTFYEVPDFYDFSNVIDMGGMFENCSYFQTIPLIDTRNVTRMEYMFANCSNLQTIPLIDTSNVTNMGGMFENCSSLQTIPELDTSNVTNMNSMFYNCRNLINVPPLNAENLNMTGSYQGLFMYNELPNLTDFGGLIGLKYSLIGGYTFPKLPNLTYQSCINILNGLYDFTGNGETPASNQGRLFVHQNFLTTVGDEISIGTNKGWTITA